VTGDYVTVAEAAWRMGRGKSTIRRLCATGRLPAVKYCSQWHIARDAVMGEAPWETITVAARRLGVTERTVRRMCAEGKLEAVRGPWRSWHVKPGAVPEYQALDTTSD
jgi:excisionase family DNA binding protein